MINNLNKLLTSYLSIHKFVYIFVRFRKTLYQLVQTLVAGGSVPNIIALPSRNVHNVARNKIMYAKPQNKKTPFINICGPFIGTTYIIYIIYITTEFKLISLDLTRLAYGNHL